MREYVGTLEDLRLAGPACIHCLGPKEGRINLRVVGFYLRQNVENE